MVEGVGVVTIRMGVVVLIIKSINYMEHVPYIAELNLYMDATLGSGKNTSLIKDDHSDSH
jgi:hypothetical protein